MYNGIEIKQYSKVTYLGCLLDETMSGESMALKTIKKINQKLKFLYRKNQFLTPELRRLLCNAIIQPHFDYACSAWYPHLTQNLKRKASSYAKQMYSLLSSIRQNVCNISYRI